jgi:phosphatidylserine decarboxylase
MSNVKSKAGRLEVQPLPANMPSTQPGGGLGYDLEQAWGKLRRTWLRLARGGYVRRMAELRRGSLDGCPIEVLDPRDLKFFCNRCDAHWVEADDPFRWRKSIPFARWGLAELQMFLWPLVAAAVALGFWQPWAALVPVGFIVFVLWFFRDPPREVPQAKGLLVSPADGTLAEVTRLPHDPFIDGPAVRIGIFLSVFNVHINRVPDDARVIELRYARGEFLNALKAESAERNENLWIGLQGAATPYRRMVVRQIAGAIARRIVCDLRPGEMVVRGDKFGMIKFGSRTELIVPDEAGLEILVKPGDKLQGGATVLCRYPDQPTKPFA